MEEAPEANRITAGTVLIELDVIRRVGGNKLTFHHHLSSLLLHFFFLKFQLFFRQILHEIVGGVYSLFFFFFSTDFRCIYAALTLIRKLMLD